MSEQIATPEELDARSMSLGAVVKALSAPFEVLHSPDTHAPAPADEERTALARLQRYTFDDPDVDPADEFVRLADVLAALGIGVTR